MPALRPLDDKAVVRGCRGEALSLIPETSKSYTGRVDGGGAGGR